MKLPADYHMHCCYSGDSKASMESMILSSIEKGLKEICFTDHMDLDYPPAQDIPMGCFELDTDSYKRELFDLQEKYRDRITVKFGVELGLQTHIVKDNKDYISKYDFDMVIASIHLLDGEDPYYPEYWKGKTTEEVMKHTFELTLENLRLFDDFDVLGHLDYMIRYTPDPVKEYSFENNKEIIDEILRLLIRSKKGLDLNTKSLYMGNSQPNPCAKILTRYKDLGGRIITFGSDAHTPEAVAGEFEKAVQIARSCGITEYCTFSHRIPQFHGL